MDNLIADINTRQMKVSSTKHDIVVIIIVLLLDLRLQLIMLSRTTQTLQ